MFRGGVRCHTTTNIHRGISRAMRTHAPLAYAWVRATASREWSLLKLRDRFGSYALGRSLIALAPLCIRPGHVQKRRVCGHYSSVAKGPVRESHLRSQRNSDQCEVDTG